MAGFLETIFKGKNNNIKTNQNKKPEVKTKAEFPVTEAAGETVNTETRIPEALAQQTESEKMPEKKQTEMTAEIPAEEAEEFTVDQTVLSPSADSEKETADNIVLSPKAQNIKENDDTSIRDIIDRLQELAEKDGKIPEHVEDVPSFAAFPEPKETEEIPEEKTGDMLPDVPDDTRPSEMKQPENSGAAEESIPAVSNEPETEEISPEDKEVIRAVPEAAETAAAQEDDYLLAQIEELRTKALNLRQIMSEKENQANELISLVEERENQAEELQKILEERQEKADGITAQVEKQIDSLIETVENRMVTIERTMNSGVDRVDDSVHTGMQSLQRDMDARLEEIRILTKDTEPMRRITEEQTLLLQTSMESDNKELLLELTRLKGELSNLKGEVAEKIHNENVKCYRNVSDLIKENDKEHKTAEEAIDGKLKSIKSFSVGIAICTAVNICGITVLILFASGLLHF